MLKMPYVDPYEDDSGVSGWMMSFIEEIVETSNAQERRLTRLEAGAHAPVEAVEGARWCVLDEEGEVMMVLPEGARLCYTDDPSDHNNAATIYAHEIGTNSGAQLSLHSERPITVRRKSYDGAAMIEVPGTPVKTPGGVRPPW